MNFVPGCYTAIVSETRQKESQNARSTEEGTRRDRFQQPRGS